MIPNSNNPIPLGDIRIAPYIKLKAFEGLDRKIIKLPLGIISPCPEFVVLDEAGQKKELIESAFLTGIRLKLSDLERGWVFIHNRIEGDIVAYDLACYGHVRVWFQAALQQAFAEGSWTEKGGFVNPEAQPKLKCLISAQTWTSGQHIAIARALTY